jgi:hypothetical protein
MEVKQVSFEEFRNSVKDKEGIVLLGAGGDPMEWINGVTNILQTKEIVKCDEEELWLEAYSMQRGPNRTDLALVFNPLGFEFKLIDLSKMAMWRIQFGDCSWISDYLVNFAQVESEAAVQLVKNALEAANGRALRKVNV